MIVGATLSAALAATVISPAGADSHTFDRAYHRARPTPIVYVQPGVYPPQTITAGGHRVVFVARGRVTVGQVELDGASGVELRGMRVRGWVAYGGSHITFRNVQTLGAFYIDAPASWISVIGGSVGPSRNENSYIAVPNDSVTQPSRHILIDGVRFHDVTRDPGSHVECLMLAQGVDVTIRDSTFTNCSVFDLYVTWWGFRPAVPPPSDVTIENNRFDRTSDGYYSVHWTDDDAGAAGLRWNGYTFSGNRCGQAADLAGAVPRTNFVVRANHGC